jgi:hypothetical protein
LAPASGEVRCHFTDHAFLAGSAPELGCPMVDVEPLSDDQMGIE